MDGSVTSWRDITVGRSLPLVGLNACLTGQTFNNAGLFHTLPFITHERIPNTIYSSNKTTPLLMKRKLSKVFAQLIKGKK